METPELVSITIEEVQGSGSLSGPATIITAAVTAVISVTSSVVGAVKAKKMREEMQRQQDNINSAKNYVIDVIRSYNAKAYEIRDSGYTTLSGDGLLTTEKERYGLINDGYAEMQRYFPEGFKGALFVYNTWVDSRFDLYNNERKLKGMKPITSRRLLHDYDALTREKSKTLWIRFKRYGLRINHSAEGHAYLIGWRDQLSEWNDQKKEHWFAVDKYGVFVRHPSKRGKPSERREEDWGRQQRERVRNDWVARLNWLVESGMMAWVYRGYYSNEKAYDVGTQRAKDDFAVVVEEVTRLNDKRLEELKQKEQDIKAGSTPSTPSRSTPSTSSRSTPSTSSRSTPSTSSRSTPSTSSTVKKQKIGVVKKAQDWWESLDKKQKTGVASGIGVGMYFLLGG